MGWSGSEVKSCLSHTNVQILSLLFAKADSDFYACSTSYTDYMYMFVIIIMHIKLWNILLKLLFLFVCLSMLFCKSISSVKLTAFCDRMLTFGKKLRYMLSCTCPEHCVNYFCSHLCHKNDALQSLSVWLIGTDKTVPNIQICHQCKTPVWFYRLRKYQ
jgi:hypothetical protein